LTSHILPLQLWTGSPEILPWGVEKINANDVWDPDGDLSVNRGTVAGQGVRVAVLDTGIDLTHPDLRSNLVALSKYCSTGDPCDFIAGDSDPSDEPTHPFFGHGSETSGNIAAVDNRLGVIGVAPKANILMYRVCAAACPTSAIVAGIEEAVADGAKVISMSFGGPVATTTEKAAVAAAHSADVVLVASSGNAGRPPVGFPARLPEVIAVGATDENDVIADFSSFGPDQELVAPGVDVPSTTVQGLGHEALFSVVSGFAPTGGRQTNPLEFSALGSVTNKRVRYVGLGTASEVADACTTADPCTGQLALIKRGEITFQNKVANAAAGGFAGAVIFNNVSGNFFGTLQAPSAIPAASLSLEDGDPLRAAIEGGAVVVGSLVEVAIDYEAVSGTSFSAPHVSGAAALVRSKNPALTNEQVRGILRSTAVDLGDPGFDFVYGFGRVDVGAAIAATS
jgi:subtilisin family serine protease